jgi:hypothetical protein
LQNLKNKFHVCTMYLNHMPPFQCFPPLHPQLFLP